MISIIILSFLASIVSANFPLCYYYNPTIPDNHDWLISTIEDVGKFFIVQKIEENFACLSTLARNECLSFTTFRDCNVYLMDYNLIVERNRLVANGNEAGRDRLIECPDEEGFVFPDPVLDLTSTSAYDQNSTQQMALVDDQIRRTVQNTKIYLNPEFYNFCLDVKLRTCKNYPEIVYKDVYANLVCPEILPEKIVYTFCDDFGVIDFEDCYDREEDHDDDKIFESDDFDFFDSNFQGYKIPFQNTIFENYQLVPIIKQVSPKKFFEKLFLFNHEKVEALDLEPPNWEILKLASNDTHEGFIIKQKSKNKCWWTKRAPIELKECDINDSKFRFKILVDGEEFDFGKMVGDESGSGNEVELMVEPTENFFKGKSIMFLPLDLSYKCLVFKRNSNVKLRQCFLNGK